MTTAQEQILEMALSKRHKIAWICPNTGECRIVQAITPAYDEPSKCAFFSQGKYVALYNCDLSDFYEMYSIILASQ